MYEKMYVFILGSILSFPQNTFTVNENDGKACFEVVLNVPAPFPFTVRVDLSSEKLASKCCIAFMYGRNHFY